jgi:hypothetical protein
MAAMMLATPRRVLGSIARPTEIYIPSIEFIPDNHRWWECPEYEKCLDIAALANWEGWTCSRCPVVHKRPRSESNRG